MLGKASAVAKLRHTPTSHRCAYCLPPSTCTSAKPIIESKSTTMQPRSPFLVCRADIHMGRDVFQKHFRVMVVSSQWQKGPADINHVRPSPSPCLPQDCLGRTLQQGHAQVASAALAVPDVVARARAARAQVLKKPAPGVTYPPKTHDRAAWSTCRCRRPRTTKCR